MKVFASVFLLTATALSFAQMGPPPGGPPMGAPPQGGRSQSQSQSQSARQQPAPQTQTQTETVRLLSLSSVQNDLGLNLTEWTALNRVVRTLKGSSVTEDQALAAVSQVLTTAQVNRLKELLVQDLGYGSLALSDVRSRLSLTTDQAAQIDSILSLVATAKKSAAPGSVKALQAQANAQLAKVLTADQDTKLRGLAGKALGS